jgi:hypothetical protein
MTTHRLFQTTLLAAAVVLVAYLALETMHPEWADTACGRLRGWRVPEYDVNSHKSPSTIEAESTHTSISTHAGGLTHKTRTGPAIWYKRGGPSEDEMPTHDRSAQPCRWLAISDHLGNKARICETSWGITSQIGDHPPAEYFRYSPHKA